MGGRKNARVVIQVPGDLGSLREERQKLPGTDPVGLFFTLVSQTGLFIRFEIVSYDPDTTKIDTVGEFRFTPSRCNG